MTPSSLIGKKLNIFIAGRADIAAKEKEREERVRRLKEQQEDDRRKKLEELKQHVSLNITKYVD